MRILQVVHQFPPAVTGGATNYTLELSLELAKSHEVHLFYTRKDLGLAQYTASEGTYRRLPFTEMIHNGLFDSFVRTYRDPTVDEIQTRVLDRLAPDVVHIHHLLFLSAELVRIAKDRGIPVVFTLHDFWLMCPRQIRMKPDLSNCFEVRENVCNRCIQSPDMTSSRLDRLRHAVLEKLGSALGAGAIESVRRTNALARAWLPHSISPIARSILARNSTARAPGQASTANPIAERNDYLKEICDDVDLFVSPSRFLREQFLQFGIPDERILWSPHGHDASWFAERAEGGSRLRFGYVGVLAQHKGCATLIDAFNRLAPDDADLNIFGDATVNLEIVHALKRRASNPSISFRGSFDRDDLDRVFREIDVLVMPSLCFENAPLTICEAFISRIPVIASRLGGMAELVEDGENGLLFDPGDAADLEKKLRQFVDRPGLVEDLACGVAPVKTIEQDARDFCDRVAGLIRANAEDPGRRLEGSLP
jgi:glycosyltransferase involved in cell wall biosynthesis